MAAGHAGRPVTGDDLGGFDVVGDEREDGDGEHRDRAGEVEEFGHARCGQHDLRFTDVGLGDADVVEVRQQPARVRDGHRLDVDVGDPGLPG